MIINGKNISEYGGKVIDKHISPNGVNNSLNWDSINPKLLESKFDYKDVSITLRIDATSEQDAISKVAKLTEMFRLGADVKFKDLDYTLKCFILAKPDVERLNHKQQYKVIFDCKAEFGYVNDEVVFSGTDTKSLKVVNNGNYPTPVSVTIVPKVDSNNLYINGLIKDFTLTKVKTGDILVVNGITGEVSCNGNVNINNFWGWNLPMITTGEITFKTNIVCDITIRFNERY